MAKTSRTAASEDLLINEILLEGMMAGLFESCQIVKPSDLGYKTLEPFDQVLQNAANADVVQAVFGAAKVDEMPQEVFLLHFLRLLQAGTGPFKELAAKLDGTDNVEAIKRIVRFLGIRFGTLFCLMAIGVEQRAARNKLLLHVGPNVQRAA